MTRENLLDKLGKIIHKAADNLNLEVVEYDFVKDHGKYYLRVIIYKPGNIGISDCEAMSIELGKLLDIEDPIEGKYYLEVSTPGLDRPIKSLDDYRRNKNKEVEVLLKEKINGSIKIEGRLSDYTEDSVLIISEDKEELCIDRSKIKLMTQVIKF